VIAINLLPGAKKKRAKGAGFQLPDFKQLAASVKEPWLLICVGMYVGFVLLVVLMYMPRRAAIAELEPQIETAQNEANRLRTALRQKAETEAKRDSLISQIEVIRAIDSERYVWPHILDQVTRALPQYTWLDELTARAAESDSAGVPEVGFQVTGKSADMQAVTRFARNLEESPFLEGVQLVSTGVVSEQGHDIFTYVLNVRYQAPDSSILTMQPLAATLVQGYRSGTQRTRR